MNCTDIYMLINKDCFSIRFNECLKRTVCKDSNDRYHIICCDMHTLAEDMILRGEY